MRQAAAFPQNTDTEKKTTVLLSPPQTLFSFLSPPPLPLAPCKSSYEVFLLFAHSLVAILLIGVLSWSQLPRRPVVSFVVTQIPVKQECQTSHRQQDENDNHWKNKAKYLLFFKKNAVLETLRLLKKFRIKCEPLPAMTAESGLVGAAVVTTEEEKKVVFKTTSSR